MTRWQSTEATEAQECRAFFEWAQTKRLIGEYLIHIPNEGKRSPQYGKSLRGIGLRPGVPDYFLAIPNAKYHGLWLEIKRKTEKGKPLRENQKDWLTRLNTMGYYAALVYGCHDAVETVLAYADNKL